MKETNDAFVAVASKVAEATDFADRIATACNEQAAGIGQISQAVALMDHSTQENAQGAEGLAATLATFQIGNGAQRFLPNTNVPIS